MKKNLLGILLTVSMAASLTVGCGGNEEPAVNDNVITEDIEEKDSVIVAMGTNSEPASGFDPAYGWGAGEHVHEPLIQSTLTVTTKELEIDYDLATDIQISEDGLTWTVTIRDDVSFTDGEALTAEDVAFTYNTVKEASSVNDFTMLKEAVAIDDTTVEFHMEKPYSIWPYTMAIVGIVPEHAYGPDYGSKPIGSGRYIMKQWDKGQQIIFEANPDYYGEEVKMKKVTIVFMEEDAAFAAAKAGQVDLAYTAAGYSEQSIEGYELLSFASVDNRGMNLPTVPRTTDADGNVIGNDFTSDINVRRAINLAIDRKQLIENVMYGYGSAAYSVCDGMPWYNEAAEVVHDLEEAVKILADAGWALETNSGIREKDGVLAEFTLMYPAGDSLRQAMAAEVANQLAVIGIKVTIEGVGWDVAYGRALSEPLMWGWGAHTPMELYNMYHTVGDSAEYSPYANATVDKYMDEALAADSLEESYELWKKAQWDGETGITQEGDIPWIWLANIDHLYWSRENLNVAEQKLHPHGHGWSIVNNVDQWTWD